MRRQLFHPVSSLAVLAMLCLAPAPEQKAESVLAQSTSSPSTASNPAPQGNIPWWVVGGGFAVVAGGGWWIAKQRQHPPEATDASASEPIPPISPASPPSPPTVVSEPVPPPEPPAAPKVSPIVPTELTTPVAEVEPVAPSAVAPPPPELPTVTSGDDQSVVEASKFNLGQTDLRGESLASVDEGLPDLPAGYGETRILLLPRDPQWAYAYWDIPNEHRESVRNQGGQRLALRLYDVTDLDLGHQAPHSLQQFDCDELARDWYLAIPVSDRDYLVEIGYLTATGQWLLLARSNPVRIPPVYPSDWFDDQFITVLWDEDLRGQIKAQLQPPTQTEPGTTIHDQMFDLAWKSMADRVSGSIYGSMHHLPGSIPPGSAQMVSGQALSSFQFPSGAGLWSLPTVSGLTMSGVGFSASMPPVRPRRFWLIADAELIVYGATEPDATVTIAGQPVCLSPDGSFRFQLSFQDGLLDYPVMAVAIDGEQTREIHLKFNRETPVRRTNTKEEAIEEWPAQD